MSIHRTPHATVITGKTSIDFHRLVMLRAGLRLESRTSGAMKLTRGASCYTRIKREFGFRGTREAVLEQFSAYVEAMRTQVEFKETT